MLEDICIGGIVMSFGEAVKSAFKNYCKFDGRARRSEYWWFFLFNFIVSTVLTVLNNIVTQGSGSFGVFGIIQVLYGLAALLPGLGLVWRRLHDIGKSGAWVLISFVPVVGAILLIVWLAKDSQPGENQYGPNPKEQPVIDEAS